MLTEFLLLGATCLVTLTGFHFSGRVKAKGPLGSLYNNIPPVLFTFVNAIVQAGNTSVLLSASVWLLSSTALLGTIIWMRASRGWQAPSETFRRPWLGSNRSRK